MIKHLWCKATIITQLHLGDGCKGQRRVGAVVGWPQHRRGTWETTVTFTCTVVKYQQKAAWSCRLTATPSSAARTNWKKTWQTQPISNVDLFSSIVYWVSFTVLLANSGVFAVRVNNYCKNTNNFIWKHWRYGTRCPFTYKLRGHRTSQLAWAIVDSNGRPCFTSMTEDSRLTDRIQTVRQWKGLK